MVVYGFIWAVGSVCIHATGDWLDHPGVFRHAYERAIDRQGLAADCTVDGFRRLAHRRTAGLYDLLDDLLACRRGAAARESARMVAEWAGHMPAAGIAWRSGQPLSRRRV